MPQKVENTAVEIENAERLKWLKHRAAIYAWRERHVEQYREVQRRFHRRYYQDNKEKVRELNERWKASHADEYKAQQAEAARARYRRNKELQTEFLRLSNILCEV